MLKKKIWNVLINLDLAVAGMSFLALVAITFFGVIRRYFLNNPLVWEEEVQLWLFLWTSFFAGSAAFRTKSHVEIDMIVELLPKAVQKVVGVCIYLLVVFVMGYLFFKSNLLVAQFIQSNNSTSVLHISSSMIYAAIPIGCVLMIINYTVVTAKDFFCKTDSAEGGNE
nr:TRAP transporter small permease [uncultured Caproiciproducens sp.]